MVVLLIAEDDDDVAFVLTRLFTRAGLTVLRAADGQAAFELAVENHPDVMVTDLGMPRLDGLQLSAAVRAHPGLSDLPIAILTGQLHPGDPRTADAGICVALLKPCTNDVLLAAVRRLLDHGPHHHDGTPPMCPLTRKDADLSSA
jgi:CheY-like chemotaxis protein